VTNLSDEEIAAIFPCYMSNVAHQILQCGVMQVVVHKTNFSSPTHAHVVCHVSAPKDLASLSDASLVFAIATSFQFTSFEDLSRYIGNQVDTAEHC
jgi:hypothetical protein